MADNLPSNILVIDTDPATAGNVADKLAKQYKINVVSATDVESARYQFESGDFPLVFVDVSVEGLPGLVLIQKLRNIDVAKKRATCFVYMTGKQFASEEESLLQELGGIETINKPFNMIAVLPYLSRGLNYYNQNQKFENEYSSALEKLESADITTALSSLSQDNYRIVDMKFDLYSKGKDAKGGLEFFIQELGKGESVVRKYRKAHFDVLREEYQTALEPIEEADKNAPHHIERVRDLITLYVKLGSAEKAKEKVLQLISYYEDQPMVKFEMLDLLMDHKMLAASQDVAKKASNPKEVLRYFNNKGVEFKKNNDFESAIHSYERCIELYPKYKEIFRIHFNAAIAYSHIKTLDAKIGMIDHLKKCLGLNPTFKKAINVLEKIEGKKSA